MIILKKNIATSGKTDSTWNVCLWSKLAHTQSVCEG